MIKRYLSFIFPQTLAITFARQVLYPELYPNPVIWFSEDYCEDFINVNLLVPLNIEYVNHPCLLSLLLLLNFKCEKHCVN